LLLPTLLLIGVSLCEVLELVVSFPTSPSLLKTKFVCISYCVFGFGGFIGSFLWEVLTSPYLFFYLLLILGLYVVHWIGLSLSFSKIPGLLKTESGHKSYDRFHLLIFPVGANPVAPDCTPGGQFWAGSAELYTGRSGVRTGVVPKSIQNVFLAQVRRSSGCAPGGPAQSPVRPTFDQFLPEFCLQRPYFDLL
jgi:hypothetical protein